MKSVQIDDYTLFNSIERYERDKPKTAQDRIEMIRAWAKENYWVPMEGRHVIALLGSEPLEHAMTRIRQGWGHPYEKSGQETYAFPAAERLRALLDDANDKVVAALKWADETLGDGSLHQELVAILMGHYS